MNKSSSSPLKKELTALPIARIETMDQSYVLLLREYLFTNGCQVFVNSGPTENVTYLFIVGDSNFVKKTLAFRHELGKKQLIICWDPEDHESIKQFLGTHSKIVYIDPIPLTQPILTEIFTFLFTTKGKELDMQTQAAKKTHKQSCWDDDHINNISSNDVVEEEPQAPLDSGINENIQKNRIQIIISDMFGGKFTSYASVSESGEARSRKNTQEGKGRVMPNTTIAIFLSIFIFIAPFLLYIGSFLLRGWALVSASANFKDGKRNEVAKNIKNERIWSGFTHVCMPFVHTVLRLPMGIKTIQAYERIDTLFDTIAEVESELLTLNDAVLSIGSSLLLGKSGKEPLSPVVAVDTIRRKMPSIKNKLDLASAYLQSSDDPNIFPFSFPSVRTQIERVSEKLGKLRQISEVGERISQIYPFIGGFRDKQRMLILLQNSGELRPTGGFIGSLAHLTISEGSLTDIRIEDVYTLDGQLKGHVDPPTPIKDLLAQEHWYLRDSNWNPDFSKTAKEVQFFYEKETGEHVESVMGVTSSFLVKILKAIGPVDIPFYNDRITADNFYLKSLYYTQKNFFPGSSQKKDFLGALMEALLTKLQTNSQSGIAIMEIIHDSLVSRDIQWYSSNTEGQQAIEQFGWGGKVPAGSTCLTLENQPPCFFSYAYINEANVSVNKVNAFIDRSQTRLIQISEEGKVSETITRKIQNLSQGESGTGGYLTYVRIFFQSSNMLTNLTLDGKPVPMKDEKAKSQTIPYGELDVSLPGLTGIGIALEVAPGRERTISVTISHGETILTDTKEALMTVFEQKQAGVDMVPVTTTVNFPPAWEAAVLPSTPTSRIIAKQGYLQYNTLLSQDSEFSFRLIR